MTMMPISWLCVDCGVNTAPGCATKAEVTITFAAAEARGEEGSVNLHIDDDAEIYCVRDAVWKASGMEPYGGCLCIGCLEARLGRALRPKDFMRSHPFATLPGTERLLKRQRRS